MKKSTILLASFAALMMIFTACNKDDIVPDANDKLDMQGTWKIAKINFTDEAAVWDDAIEYTARNAHNYAPFMFLAMDGIEFQTGDIVVINPEDSSEVYLGKKLQYISKQTDEVFHTDLFDKDDWWYWNYNEDETGFEIGSINARVPSPCYAMNVEKDNVTKISNSQLKINTTVQSKNPETGENQDLSIEITLERGDPDDIRNVFVLDEPFNRMP